MSHRASDCDYNDMGHWSLGIEFVGNLVPHRIKRIAFAMNFHIHNTPYGQS